MKKIAIVLALLPFICTSILAQEKTKRECSAKMRKTAGPKVDSTLLSMKKSQLRLDANENYMIKLFVVIFADDDGSNVAASSEDVRRQIENMARFYQPHNICFVLAGTQQSNNTDLNNHNTDTEEDEVAIFRRTGYVSIFVHSILFNSEGSLNGMAYGIPNNYLSIVGSAVADSLNISTMAHEMGHCFGLYHTFETANGVENVLRYGDCRDCEGDGDYLCDTNADLELDADDIDPDDCRYQGGLELDECGPEAYLFEIENIMAYGRRPCRNHFTNGQGARARDFIVTESDLSAALAVENLQVILPESFTNGLHMYTARSTVTFDAIFISTETARISVSANEIIVKPGTQFKPTQGVGYAILRPNTFCD